MALYIQLYSTVNNRDDKYGYLIYLISYIFDIVPYSISMIITGSNVYTCKYIKVEIRLYYIQLYSTVFNRDDNYGQYYKYS